VDVAFLDANVLFSAAYRPTAILRGLWDLTGTRLVTSVYAAEEARRNLRTPRQREDLATLLDAIDVGAARFPAEHPVFTTIRLPERDRPILLAAIHARATHLLTGDIDHFGAYFEQRIAGILIQLPAVYLRARRSEEERRE